MTLRVTTDFATGNGLSYLSGERALALDRDIRDSTGDRWYWHIGLTSPTDKEVRVEMARPLLLGEFGPAVRRGGSYEWRYAKRCAGTHFDISLAGGNTVYVCATIPYGPSELAAFRARLGARGGVDWRTLESSESGREVPLLLLPAERPEAIILLTARHHACEAMASFVLEGAVQEFARLRLAGDSVALSAVLVAVPMMDIDGVCAGDQGKGRQPWDHGRDYGETSKFRSVSALRKLMMQDDRPTYALDLHTPGLRGPLEEVPYIVTSGDPGNLGQARDLLTALASFDNDHITTPEILIFDEEWNSASSASQRCCSAWLRSLRSTRLALIIEHPNAVNRGSPVLPADARRFGAALLCSLIELMR